MIHPPPRVRNVSEHPTATATVRAWRPMLYRYGADPRVDRPAHVRAGSGVVFWHGRLAVVQDDTSILALVDRETGVAEAVLLPAIDGVRQFGSDRGNKHRKLDLESVVVLGDGSLVSFGSGSTEARFRVMRLAHPDATPRVFQATGLYRALLARTDFAGSELNLEGVCRLGDRVRFFQRGNGAVVDGRAPVDATLDVSLADLEVYLARAEIALDAPWEAPLGEVCQWSLGALGGVRLTFTDATAMHDRDDAVLWLGAAEDSPDTYRDGVCTGSAIGWMDGNDAWFVPLRGPDGAPLAVKAEGITLDPDDPTRAWVVVDLDDPTKPSELLDVALHWPKVT